MKTLSKFGIATLAVGTAIVYRRQIAYRLGIAKTLGDIIAAHVQSQLTGRPVSTLLAAKLATTLGEPWIQTLPAEAFDDKFSLSST